MSEALVIKLSPCQETGSAKQAGRGVMVFYGACYPLMERMLDLAHTFRAEGQNCVDMLLGNELFTRELLAGAFFLLEEWAQRWEYVVTKTFGAKNWGAGRSSAATATTHSACGHPMSRCWRR